MNSRTIIVSNRLPLNVNLTEDNKDFVLVPSVGGLATGMKSIHQKNDSLWIGWSGIASDKIDKKLNQKITEAIEKEKCLNVPLSQKELDGYYFGFSNRVIWPLFHYFTEYATFSEKMWKAYQSVNQKFAEVILGELNEGDKVWIHDYQFLLLPELIKKVKPNVSVGFFLHIPFPSFEIFRVLPWREQLLKGLLGADLIGFHVYDYERHFISSVKRILNLEVDINQIKYNKRRITVDSFPMGIDFDKFYQAASELQEQKTEDHSELQQSLLQYKNAEPNTQYILSIDRLDYTKGIKNRLKGFELFLEKYPEYHGNVRFIMLAVPSRENVPRYQTLKKEIDELVGRINGKYSTINWSPILYFYRSLPFSQLVELYATASVALLTPIRDGMNLVAKEYIASRIDLSGVLILSEMAGAAQEMSEALIINPNNYIQIADSLKQALEMSLTEQKRRNKFIQKRIKRYNIEKWASDFMQALEQNQSSQMRSSTTEIDEKILVKLHQHQKSAQHKIAFLDYDGTLVDFHSDPQKATPKDAVFTLLEQMIKSSTKVVIISGRDRHFLEQWFGNFAVELVAEHGIWRKQIGKDWELSYHIDNNWMEAIKPIIENFVDRTPGSFLEEKEYSLAWHYRKTDPELGLIRANEISNVLTEFLNNRPLSVLNGHKVIEVKNGEINKGNAANKILQQNEDFILAIGDDWTDEFMFQLLPQKTISIKVGAQETTAKYAINHQENVTQNLMKIFS